MNQSFRKNKWIWISLVLMDLLGTLAAFCASFWIRIESQLIPYNAEASLNHYLLVFLYSIPVFVLIFRGVHLYDRHDLFYGTTEYIQILKGYSLYLLGFIIISFIIHIPSPSRGWIFGSLFLGILFISGERFVFRRVLRRLGRKGYPLERVLILGANEEAKTIAERLERSSHAAIVGFLDEFSPQGERVWEEKKILGPPTDYGKIIREQRVDLVILVPEAVGWETQREILAKVAGQNDVELQIAPGFSELYSTSMRVSFKGNIPLLRFRPGYITGLDSFLKALIDYSIGSVLLLFALPLILIFGLILWIQGGRPLTETHTVFGKNGCSFNLIKFRTGAPGPTSYRSFKKRVPLDFDPDHSTPMGRFLLRTALDKLPQLFNVLMGQTSIIGPRVISEKAAKAYGSWLPGILAVKPGMTGDWAIRNSKNLEQEINLTLYYVRNWSIWKDFTILAQTFFEMFRTRLRSRIIETPEDRTGERGIGLEAEGTRKRNEGGIGI